jgi:alpha-glucosidase
MPQTKATKPTATTLAKSAPWWQKSVIYQIYVRSFYDSDGDGVGDICGIIQKLDYIVSLGVDAIWLSPVTVSANIDWGYDVIDYYNIDPSLGTLADYDQLIAEAKKKGIRVIMDLVPNHTSIKHPWFKDALKSKQAKYRDYYLWADAKPGNKPPSNWRAYGGGSAWQLHRRTGQYYLHSYFKEQVDLNWRNPAVLDEFDRIMRFWLDRGVAGFRLDVFNVLIKDRQLRDNPKATKADGIENLILGQRTLYNLSQPETHAVLKRWRTIINEYDGLLLGESAFIMDVPRASVYYGERHDEVQLIMNLAFLHSAFTARSKRTIVEITEDVVRSPDWPVWTGSNHDEKRYPTDWGGGQDPKIRCATLMLLTLRGTPILYYGDELGMERVFIAPWRMKDPRGKRNWPVDGGRDRYRTPMPWKNQFGAGFTRKNVRPWLPYGDLRTRSVEAEEATSDSILQFTRDLIALRRKEPELLQGGYETLPTVPLIWAWRRGERTVVALNLSNEHQEIKDISGEVIFSTIRSQEKGKVGDVLRLDPWQGVIVRLNSR